MSRIDLDKAIEDPRHFFKTPEEVMAEPGLNDREKLAILESWERDARELAVAEEESMGGGEPDMLDRIIRTADALRAEPTSSSQAATKHGVATHGAETSLREGAGKTVGMVMTGLDEVVHVDVDVDEAKVRIQKLEIPLLPVVDGEEIVGIVTDEDIAANRETAGDARSNRVGNVLSTEISFCYVNDPLETARQVMDESGHPRLLVINEQDELVGVVTRDSIETVTRHPVAHKDAEEWLGRTEQGPGRDTGGASGGPRSYSVKPIIRHHRSQSGQG